MKTTTRRSLARFALRQLTAISFAVALGLAVSLAGCPALLAAGVAVAHYCYLVA